jgi:hypothetical protein
MNRDIMLDLYISEGTFIAPPGSPFARCRAIGEMENARLLGWLQKKPLDFCNLAIM